MFHVTLELQFSGRGRITDEVFLGHMYRQVVVLRVPRENGNCRELCLFPVFLGSLQCRGHKAREYKGRRFINPRSGNGGDKLAFLSNNAKLVKCLNIHRVQEIRDCLCYVHIVPINNSITGKEIKAWPSTSLRLTKIEIFQTKVQSLETCPE